MAGQSRQIHCQLHPPDVIITIISRVKQIILSLTMLCNIITLIWIFIGISSQPREPVKVIHMLGKFVGNCSTQVSLLFLRVFMGKYLFWLISLKCVLGQQKNNTSVTFAMKSRKSWQFGHFVSVHVKNHKIYHAPMCISQHCWENF